MSSAKKGSKNVNIKPPTSVPAPSGPIKLRTDKEGFVQLNLHVKPGAKISRVAEITENHIGLQVKYLSYYY